MKCLKLFLLLAIWGILSCNLIAQINQPSVSAGNLQVGTVINWTIEEQTEQFQFVVEKSKNGTNFFPIFDTVSEVATLNYSFLDINAKEKISFYRIKQMTSDGSYIYSETVQIQLVFPNNLIATKISDLGAVENRGKLSIALTTAKSGAMTYTIEDIHQEVLTSGVQDLVIGDNELILDFSLFPIGEYAVRMKLDEEVDVLILEKQADLIRLEAGMNNQKVGEFVRKYDE